MSTCSKTLHQGRSRRFVRIMRTEGLRAFGAAVQHGIRWRFRRRWLAAEKPKVPATTDRSSTLAGEAAAPVSAAPTSAIAPERSAPRLWREPGHFYSPIVVGESIRHEASRIWPTPAPTFFHGIDLRLERQVARLQELARFHEAFPEYGPELIPNFRFRTENRMYGLGDAALLYAFMRDLQPRNVVEIGSGFSSAVVLDTAQYFLEESPKVTLVEPHPERLYSVLWSGDDKRVDVIERRLQDIDISIFTALQANDILIIDSSHVVKTASDVNLLFFEVLPQLVPGVLVHIHDIGYPFEYPRSWVEEGRSWNEVYLLRAFLMFNAKFEIELWNGSLRAQRPDAYRECPRYAGGSQIWIRRTRS